MPASTIHILWLDGLWSPTASIPQEFTYKTRTEPKYTYIYMQFAKFVAALKCTATAKNCDLLKLATKKQQKQQKKGIFNWHSLCNERKNKMNMLKTGD